MKPRQHSRRHRWVQLGWAALVAFPVLIALGLLDHLRPRHAYFDERQGRVEGFEVVQDRVDASGFVSDSVRVRSTTGLAVDFRVLRPVATDARVPLVVMLAGHRTGQNAVELVGDPGAMAVAALDYPYHGPEKLHGFRVVAKNLPAIQRTLLDTPPAVSLVLDWLLRQPWVDPARVELIGASLGTPFAAVAGARDERFRRVWLIHGGARNREWLEGALREDIANDLARGMAASLLHLLAHGASFDTEEWVARIAPRPVVVIGAREDESLTRDNIVALYQAAGEPRRLLWTEGRHVTRQRPEIVRELLALVREEIQPEGVAEGVE